MDPNHKYTYVQQKDCPLEYREDQVSTVEEDCEHSHCQFGVEEHVEAQLRFGLGNHVDTEVLLDTHGSREIHWEFMPQNQGGFSTSHEVLVKENQDAMKSFGNFEGWLYSCQMHSELFVDPHDSVTTITDAFEDKDDNKIEARCMLSFNDQQEPTNTWVDNCKVPVVIETPINHSASLSKENEGFVESNCPIVKVSTAYKKEDNESHYVEEGLDSMVDLNKARKGPPLSLNNLEETNDGVDNGRPVQVELETPIDGNVYARKEKLGFVGSTSLHVDDSTNHKMEDSESLSAEECLEVDLNRGRSGPILSFNNQENPNAWMDNRRQALVELKTPINCNTYTSKEKVGFLESNSSLVNDSKNHEDEDCEILNAEGCLAAKIDMSGARSGPLPSLNNQVEFDDWIDSSIIDKLKTPINHSAHINKEKVGFVESNSALLDDPNHKYEGSSESLDRQLSKVDSISKSSGFCKKAIDLTADERGSELSFGNHGNISDDDDRVNIPEELEVPNHGNALTKQKSRSYRQVKSNVLDDSVHSGNKDKSSSLMQIDNDEQLRDTPSVIGLLANEGDNDLSNNVREKVHVITEDEKTNSAKSHVDDFDKKYNNEQLHGTPGVIGLLANEGDNDLANNVREKVHVITENEKTNSAKSHTDDFDKKCNDEQLQVTPGVIGLLANDGDNDLANNVGMKVHVITEDEKTDSVESHDDFDKKCMSKIVCLSYEFKADDHLRLSCKEKGIQAAAPDLNKQRNIEGNEAKSPMIDAIDICREQRNKKVCVFTENILEKVGKQISHVNCFETMENDNEMQISTRNCDDVISNVVQKLISPVQYVETMERNHNKQISALYSPDRIRSVDKERMLVSSAEFDCSLEADIMPTIKVQLLIDSCGQDKSEVETNGQCVDEVVLLDKNIISSPKSSVNILVETSFSSNSPPSHVCASNYGLLDTKVHDQDHVDNGSEVADTENKTHEIPDTMLDVLVNGMNHYSMLTEERSFKDAAKSVSAVNNLEEVEEYNDEQVYEGSSKLKGRKTKANESPDSVVDDCDKDVVQHSSPIVDEKNEFNVFTSNIKYHYNLQKQATSRLESTVDVDENMEDNDVFSGMQTKRTTEQCAKIKEATIELPASNESNSTSEVISVTNISMPKVEEINQTELKFEYHSFRMTSDEIVQNGCKESPSKTSSQSNEFVEERSSSSHELHDGLSFVFNSFITNDVQQQHPSPASGQHDKSPEVLTMKPFNLQQQVQLRAQIMVYGALIQGTVPEEAQMVAAFSDPSGVLKQGEGYLEGCERVLWEKLWLESSKRICYKPFFNSSRISHKSNAVVSSSPKNSKKPSLSCSPKLLVAPKNMEINSESRPHKRKRIESVSPKTNVEVVVNATHSNNTDLSVCSSGPDINSFAAITPLYLPHVPETFLEKSIVAFHGDKSMLSSVTIADAVGNGGMMEKRDNSSCELDLAKQNAVQSSLLADHATRDSELMWSELLSQSVSNLNKDTELQLVSSFIAMKTSATIAKAAAATAKAAYEAALYANVRRENALRLIKQDNKEHTLLMENYCKENIESTLVPEGKVNHFESLSKAAELTSNAISEIGAAMTIGESPPCTLKMLVDGGIEGFEKLMSVLVSEETQKTPTRRIVVRPNSALHQIEENDNLHNMEVGPGIRSNEGVRLATHIPFDEEGVATITSQEDIAASQKEFVTSQIATNSIVEVLSDEEGLRGVWFSAKVLKFEREQVLVLYDELLLDNGKEPLEEWITLETLPGKVPRVRLAHPHKLNCKVGIKRTREDMESHKWAVGDRVDAWIRDGWWEGEISETFEDDESKVKVFFPGGGDSQLVKVSKLRQSMIWNNEMWILWSREDNNDNDMNEHKLLNSKRQKTDEVQPANSSPICKTSSRKEGVPSKDLKVPAKVKEDKSKRLWSNSILGISKTSKKKQIIEVTKHDVSRGAMESTTRRIEGLNEKARFHNRVESTTKNNVAQNLKERPLFVNKISSQKDTLTKERLHKSVNGKLTRLKPPVNQLQSNLHAGGIPPMHNSNIEGLNKRIPSVSVQKNGDEHSRVNKQRENSAAVKSKQPFPGRDPLRSLNEKKGVSQHQLKEIGECSTHPVHVTKKSEKGSYKSDEAFHLVKENAMEMGSDKSDNPPSDLSEQNLNQVVEKEKEPLISVGVNQKCSQKIAESDKGIIGNDESEIREPRRTCRKITPSSKLLEGLQTAPVVRSNTFHDKASKPNSNVCK